MSTLSISQMDPVTNVTAQDLIEVAIPDQGSASGYKTGKESLAQIGNLIATGISYAGLPTSDQTLTGAITEIEGKVGSHTKTNMTATSYITITEAYYIEYPEFYYVNISATAAQNIPANTAIIADTPPIANSANVPYIHAGSGVFELGAAVFGTSTNFIVRNSLNNGDLIAFTGTIAK